MLDDGVDRVMQEYARDLRTKCSAGTVRLRTQVIRGRLHEWGGIAGVTPDNLSEWLGRPVTDKGTPPSPWTRSSYFSHARDFTAWAFAAGYLAEDPMMRVSAPRAPKSEPRPLSERDVTRVMDAATGDVRTWIMLALHAGLRSHEAAKIRGEDVSAEWLHVIGKGGKRANLPTSDVVWDLAQQYPRRGWWFPSPLASDRPITAATVSRRVGLLFESLGIEGSLHRCRHTYATRLLRSGTHVRHVQKLMRHDSLNTTAAYTALDEDELRAAVNRLSA